MKTYNLNMEELALLKEDCAVYGHGRKKWWSEKVGVPQLTVSHWLAGRQRPNSDHLKTIQDYFKEIDLVENSQTIEEHFWSLYYRNFELSPRALKFFVIELLKSDTVSSRLIGLLSFYVEKLEVSDFKVPRDERLKNKLGWLMETSNILPSFEPSEPSEPILLTKVAIPQESQDAYLGYLKIQQTDIGRKWHVYDFSLGSIKRKLIWKQNINRS